MSDLIERYIHQVGYFVPPKERAEIEAELRSQIQDTLDDRYAGTVSEEEIAAVLAELGAPYRIAASYNREQYLIGPDVYPFLMMALRRVWLIVPSIAIFFNVFGALTAPEPPAFADVVLGVAGNALQATLVVSALVVLIFAIGERLWANHRHESMPFNPLTLPEATAPGFIDRFEAATGTVLGIFGIALMLYYVRVGGLTLRFDLNDPGEVIPFPPAWMILLIITLLGQVMLYLLVVRGRQWRSGLWVMQILLEIIGVICFYFAVTHPVFTRIIADNPHLADVVFIDKGAELFAMSYAVLTLVNSGSKLVRLWQYERSQPLPFALPSHR